MWIGLGTFYALMKLIFIWMAHWILTIAISGVKTIIIRIFKLRCMLRSLRYGAYLPKSFCSVRFSSKNKRREVLCHAPYTGKRYALLLASNIVPSLQAPKCLDKTIFMQYKAHPHVVTWVKNVFRKHVYRKSCHLSPVSSCLAWKIPRFESLWFVALELFKQLVDRDNTRTYQHVSRTVFSVISSTLPKICFTCLLNIRFCNFKRYLRIVINTLNSIYLYKPIILCI